MVQKPNEVCAFQSTNKTAPSIWSSRQNWHAVGFKTLPPSQKPTRDWFSLNQKYFHQDEQEHLVIALNVWVLWKSKSVIPCVYLQSLTRKTQGEHLFSGETAPWKAIGLKRCMNTTVPLETGDRSNPSKMVWATWMHKGTLWDEERRS